MTSRNVLQEPQVLESVGGFLNVTISLEESILEMDGFVMKTRTFNGTIPGPTLVLSAGDTLNVKFVNLLEDQGRPYVDNQISAPDESNLHWHGLHVSGEAPSDDALLVIRPGETYDYTSVLPENHHPGLHWLHPHRHGSTTIQVGGGAAAAIIVRDSEDSEIPSIYTQDTRQVLIVVQPLLSQGLLRIVSNSRDGLFAIQDRELSASKQEKILLVNGQVQPIIDDVVAGEWIRLRIIHAAWAQDFLTLTIPDCQMELIAKDGIYLPEIPRTIPSAPIVPAGRADIMVKCPKPSTSYDILDEGRVVVATIETNASVSSSLEESLPTHIVDYPEYLQDLRSAPVLEDCSCITNVGDNDGINGFRFSYDHTVHHYQLGQVVERIIDARNHPYHQHVYPFQLVDGFDESLANGGGGNTNNQRDNRGDDNNRDDVNNGRENHPYYQLGDWHDTMEDEGVIRYLPTVFASKIMLHCHRLDHEDKGMMGIERMADQCECGEVLSENDFPLWASVGLGVIGLLILVGAFCTWKRRRQSSESL